MAQIEIDLGPQDDVLTDVAADGARLVEYDGKIIAVRRTQTGFIAVEERCPHRAGPMSEARIADGRLICPWHGAEFDIHTGEVKKGPAKRCLGIHQVRLSGDNLYLSVNDKVPT